MFIKDKLTISILIILIVVILFTIAIYADNNKIVVGEPAPDFTLNDLNDDSISLLQFKGKYVIINFWSIYCQGCTEELPVLEDFNSEKGENIVLLTINLDEEEREVREYLNKNNYSEFMVLFDKTKKVMKQYNLKRIPMFYFINPDGIIKGLWEGSIEKGELDKKIEKLFE